MDKKIVATVLRFGGVEFDGVYVDSSDLEKTIKELYLNQGFSFVVRPACYRVPWEQVAKVKKLLGV